MSTTIRGFKLYQQPAAPQTHGSTNYSTSMNLFNVQQRAQQLASQNAGQGHATSMGGAYGQRPQQQPYRDDYEREYSLWLALGSF